jgi:transcription antitermination factor NusB
LHTTNLEEFAQKLLTDVITHQKTIDEYIAKHADNWELDRMAIIDKNLMRIAIAEFLFMEDVPPKVTINEAIEISKKYSTDKSGKFINGILDATLNELRQSGKVAQIWTRAWLMLPAKQPKHNATPAPPAEKPPSSFSASSPKIFLKTQYASKPSPNSSSKKPPDICISKVKTKMNRR